MKMGDLGVPHKPLMCEAAKLSPQAKSSSSFTIAVNKPINSMANSVNSSSVRARADVAIAKGVHSNSTAMLQRFAAANAALNSTAAHQAALKNLTSAQVSSKNTGKHSKDQNHNNSPLPSSWSSIMNFQKRKSSNFVYPPAQQQPQQQIQTVRNMDYHRST